MQQPTDPLGGGASHRLGHWSVSDCPEGERAEHGARKGSETKQREEAQIKGERSELPGGAEERSDERGANPELREAT